MKKEPHYFSYNGEKIPFFHLLYEGCVPGYEARNPGHVNSEGIHYRTHYMKETFKQYDFDTIDLTFRHAVAVIIHHFKDNRPRDLDNIQSKYLLDSIRRTGIIHDDSWQCLAHFLMGEKADRDFAEVLLVSSKDFIPLLMETDLRGGRERKGTIMGGAFHKG